MDRADSPQHPVGQTLPREVRIRSRGDFKHTYAEGRKSFGRTVVVFLRPNGLPQARLGVTVTRRVGTAVVRNRLKRRVREAFRRGPRPPAGLDIVVNVRDSAVAAPFEELAADFQKTVSRGLKALGSVEGRG